MNNPEIFQRGHGKHKMAIFLPTSFSSESLASVSPPSEPGCRETETVGDGTGVTDAGEFLRTSVRTLACNLAVDS